MPVFCARRAAFGIPERLPRSGERVGPSLCRCNKHLLAALRSSASADSGKLYTKCQKRPKITDFRSFEDLCNILQVTLDPRESETAGYAEEARKCRAGLCEKKPGAVSGKFPIKIGNAYSKHQVYCRYHNTTFSGKQSQIFSMDLSDEMRDVLLLLLLLDIII